jgi:type II secretory pathway component PulL
LDNTPDYDEAFFESYGNRYQNRRLNDAVLEQAAELWKAAAPKIKKIVDNHRSGVAQKYHDMEENA